MILLFIELKMSSSYMKIKNKIKSAHFDIFRSCNKYIIFLLYCNKYLVLYRISIVVEIIIINKELV